MRLTIHQAGNGYIGRLLVTLEDRTKLNQVARHKLASRQPHTIFIVDRSGSMGQDVQRLIGIVIPGVARRYFHMESNDTYTLITFDSVTETIVKTVAEWERSNLRAGGCTYMAGVFSALLDNLRATDNPNIRIVAISDGAIMDTEPTLRAASLAASTLKQSRDISATAIRLFTANSEPDTRALASVLQMNTVNSAGSIVDIRASDTAEGLEAMVDVIGTAVGEAGCTVLLTLKADLPCFLQVPWAEPLDELSINADLDQNLTTIWLASPPRNPKLNGEPIAVDLRGDRVTQDTLHILLKDKIDYFLNHLRVLKVLNSSSAQEELSRIVSYFQELEDSLPPPTELESLLADHSLAGRAQYIKASLSRRIKSITHTMQSIANDERIANLNMAQQAEYLRQAEYGRNSKALARRAERAGMDFSATIQAEILAMAAHIAELDQVDDSHHAVSFYSSATTLEGIRYVVEIANEPELLQHLTAVDLLRLFNIVGIPAVAPIGDYPDPMCYRVDKLLYGTYVSVADITMALHHGGTLQAPGHSDQIVTAIPFFEDWRVQHFLQRYARSSLDYIASIGMRRMLAVVPKTYPYTVCAGLWKMVEELDKHGKTEIRVKNFQHLVTTYERVSQEYFELKHILPLLETNQDPAKSYNLAHNGITNMIAPILYKIRREETLYMPRILRALFSFESYQVMRRAVCSEGPADSRRQGALDKILGVDFSSDRATSLPDMFTRTVPQHCEKAVVNREVLCQYSNKLGFVFYATLMEPLFSALIHSEDAIKAVQGIPPMTNEFVTKALDLPSDISLEDFMLFNCVEGLLCTSKASRIDKETDLPKLGDLGTPGVGTAMISTYVKSRYEVDYQKRLKAQLDQEQLILQNEMVDVMVKTDDLSEYTKCIHHGHQRGPIQIMMENPCSPGFSALHKRLMDISEIVNQRANKLYIIYSGRSIDSEDCKIFNGGNMYLGDWKPLHTLLSTSENKNDIHVWEKLQEDLHTRGHIYRGGSDLANRHGHSNDLMSYFAYNCQSLAEFRNNASEDEWCKYIVDHCQCCGVAQFLARTQATGLGSQ